MSHAASKCDECGADAPAVTPLAFFESKPLVDGKWLCDACFGRATETITNPDGSLNLGGISPETLELWKP